MTHAIFSRTTGDFLAFASPSDWNNMQYSKVDCTWLDLSAAQQQKLRTLTDGDHHVNAMARRDGASKVRIFGY